MANQNPQTLKQAKAQQETVFKKLDALSKTHGPEVFRIIGQRYFTNQKRKAALHRQIAERERALEELRKKAGR